MSKWTTLAAASLVALIAGSFTITAFAAPQPVLSSHVPGPVARHELTRLRDADPNRVMSLNVALPMRNQDRLDDLLRQIYDPASPLYRHYLSVEQFTESFGPAKADYDQAVKFFGASGLRVTSTYANRYMVDVVGKVADIERVFHVQLGMYRHPSGLRDFIAPDREPSLDIGVPVLHVIGLTDYELPHSLAKHRVGHATPNGGSGPGGYFIGSDLRAAYYGNGSLTGTGQRIGILELEPYDHAEVGTYFNKVGQATPTVNAISVGGASTSCTGCSDEEPAIDIEYAGSVAPGATLDVYVGASTGGQVLNAEASANTDKQLSSSWSWSQSENTTDTPIFKEMAAQGQTVLQASGDHGALNAANEDLWPMESDNVVAVGGTSITTASAGGAWKSEVVWDQSNGSSGGGISKLKTQTIESYQKPLINSANGGSTKLRNVPDVAAQADEDNYICYSEGCEGGWGGTSLATPVWAGIIALANQQAAADGKAAVGFINPAIYGLATGSSYKTTFHDIVSGTNGTYKATTGYDLCTGLGSPQAALINALVP